MSVAGGSPEDNVTLVTAEPGLKIPRRETSSKEGVNLLVL
jgi:hypothetical protein